MVVIHPLVELRLMLFVAGRNWRNSAGAQIATSGSNPVNVNSAGIIVDPINADHGLMNQESQDVDSAGQIHAIISYIPGTFLPSRSLLPCL
jgi:BNR repeat-containing family member